MNEFCRDFAQLWQITPDELAFRVEFSQLRVENFLAKNEYTKYTSALFGSMMQHCMVETAQVAAKPDERLVKLLHK